MRTKKKWCKKSLLVWWTICIRTPPRQGPLQIQGTVAQHRHRRQTKHRGQTRWQPEPTKKCKSDVKVASLVWRYRFFPRVCDTHDLYRVQYNLQRSHIASCSAQRVQYNLQRSHIASCSAQRGQKKMFRKIIKVLSCYGHTYKSPFAIRTVRPRLFCHLDGGC